MDTIRRTTAGRLTALAAVAVTVLVTAGGPAASAPATDDGVYGALGVDHVPADYVVMVDVSGSMQGDRYAQVKRSLKAFFAALAPDDQVTLVPFAETAIAQTGPAGRAPDQLIAKLPTTADGRNTDIGAAIEKAVDVLRRNGAPPIATVVLLTDGEHDPPAGSAYPFVQGYQWDQLARSAKALKKTSIDAYAVPLSGTTGAPLLGKVFPGAKVLDPTSIDGLSAQLEQPKAAARAAKARSILGDDTANGVRVRWPDGDIGAGRTDLDVRLQSTTAHIPLVVDDLAVSSANPHVRASVAGGPVALRPGGTATVRVTVDWDAGPRRVVPLSTVTGQAALTLTGRVGSPWSEVMTKRLGLAFAPAVHGGATNTGMSAQRGSITYWMAGAALLLAMLAALWRWRRRRLSPALSGALRIRTASGEQHQLPLVGRMVVLNAGTAGLPGNGEVSATRPSVGSPTTDLVITYSRDGSAASRESCACASGETVVVSGVEFTWQSGVASGRDKPPTASRSLG